MSIGITAHCDGEQAGDGGSRRCLSYAAVRSDPGTLRADPDLLVRAIRAGFAGYYPDAGDGVNCDDFVPVDDADPWRRATVWHVANRGAGVDVALFCPLHNAPAPV